MALKPEDAIQAIDYVIHRLGDQADSLAFLIAESGMPAEDVIPDAVHQILTRRAYQDYTRTFDFMGVENAKTNHKRRASRSA